MKKTTKILLVLAAVVAMTIGAVSTVMAADEYQTIGAWSYDSNAKTYSATDVNGEQIVRGWAVENGRWYYYNNTSADTDTVYIVVDDNVVTGGAIELDASVLAELDGEKVLAKNFFLKTINSKKEVVYYYFEYGKMIKNEAIKFGDTVVAIDKDGLVRTADAGEEITIDGIKYKFVDDDTASLTLGDDIVINGLARKK